MRILRQLVWVVAIACIVVPLGGARTLDLPGDQSFEGDTLGGHLFDYDSAGFDCIPPPGTVFPVGVTHVDCGPGVDGFTVTVTDTSGPSLSVPSSFTFEATGAQTPVSYTATASDIVDGAVDPGCSPASGSSFSLGQNTVTCQSSDSHGNASEQKSFTITVNDTTPPAFTSAPSGSFTAEATSAAGAVVSYPLTASDSVDAAPDVSCGGHEPGVLFPLGNTSVSCTATDDAGNTGNAAFTISVVDTTAPALIVPGDFSVYATTPGGIPASNTGVQAFLQSGSANDTVDPAPTLTNNAPGFFPVGATSVTWTATDASGNPTSKTSTLTVLPMPPAGTTPTPLPPLPDITPPDDVGSLAAQALTDSVELTWKRPKAADFDHVVITRSANQPGAAGREVYRGAGTSFVDSSVERAVEYRYVAISYDHAGNPSAGVAAVAFVTAPTIAALLSPGPAAQVKTSAKFRWLSVEGARYYNLQIFRGRAHVKVLSAWPIRTSFVLKRTWKYGGKRYKLTRGLYTWYVWPGFGPKSAAQYGPLIGSSTFQVVR